MNRPGARRLTERLQGTPVLHLADQVLSSGTNFLAVVVVARLATPQQFGLFSIVLVTFFMAAGFNRAVPHAIAMTLEWDDERARNGYFFLPPLVLGTVLILPLIVAYALLDLTWVGLAVILLPLLLQDAVRMHAFAVHKPMVAVLSDAVWLAVEGVGFLLVSTAVGATLAWGLGGLAALLVTRPWRIRMRVQRRPIRTDAISASFEYATLAGLGYLTPLLASPIITLVGVGALQGANVVRGPIILLVQALLVYRMAGPPITPRTCLREARNLSGTTFVVALLCIPPILLWRDAYGPRLLGPTWPGVEPLILPALLTLVLGSAAFGPATVARRMGRFQLSAKLQGGLSPLFVAFPLIGATVAGTQGFVYATAVAYAVLGATWWVVLLKVAARPAASTDLALN